MTDLFQPIPDEQPAPAIRLCPTCEKPMEWTGRHWICPVARSEARMVSEARRQSVIATAEQREPELPF
jgi:hypothetical protein